MEKDFTLSAVIARVAGVAAVLLALGEVLLDWTTLINLNVSILYGLPLVVAASTRSKRLLWALAVFLLVTIFAVYWVQIPPAVYSLREPHLVNRVLAAMALSLTAVLLHLGMVGLDLLDGQRVELEKQNAELDQRRREAEAASSRKTRFLASVSHDIRTPLQTISLTADILCRAARNPELTTQVPDIANRLQANARALAELVGDILDLARLDTQGQLQVSEFSLTDILEQEAARLLPLAEKKGLCLKVDTVQGGLRLRTDRVKLVRVISNLLTNAIKYTNQGGVTVAAMRESNGTPMVRVSDTGVGIDPEQVQQIFDEFVQLRNPERDPKNGHGLGLAICRRLVEALGGHIAVESALGKGSSFIVRLPASSVVEAAPAVLTQVPENR